MSSNWFRRQRGSCKLCNPSKAVRDKRWRPQEEASLKRFEKAVHLRDWSAL
jgi:hypothetical protein